LIVSSSNGNGFKKNGRIVIVGASLAGLRAAEALRDEGFEGKLTIIGDEPHEPYDRPPLSKQVQKGWVKADHTKLPRLREVNAEWRLGVAAIGVDRVKEVVRLANGDEVGGDSLLIATGVRSRPWPNPAEATLEGVFTIRTCEDAARLQAALAAKPRRVLIIGAGFIGSEVASMCRDRGLEVTVAERAEAPLAGALGNVIGAIAVDMQRAAGVDLRTGVSVSKLEGDARGHVRSASLSDGTTLDVDVVVASLGSLRNVEWLEGSGLAAGFWGVGCDAGCRVFDIHGMVTNRVFVAGDIARSPHVLYDYQFLVTEFWGNAVFGAKVAAHNMVCAETERRPYLPIPSNWSGQFGVNIKTTGVPSFGDEIVFTMGSVKERRFAAAYGRQ
jgi:3-phenylpropionate/trans-cinnamate dioxygenase ferredoxin reductase subunit